MSWNCEKNKISEDKLDELSETFRKKVQDNWKVVYNPVTNKITYVNPEAYDDLRAALLATVPFQPKTILQEMQK